MKTILLLALITVSEATIGVFVKLTGDLVPIYTLNFYALVFAALFLAIALPVGSGEKMRFPWDNIPDTLIIGALIALQISVFNFAMTQAPIANVVIFWSVAPFFTFIFSALFLSEEPRKSYIFIFLLAIAGIVIAKPLQGGYIVGNLVALADGAIYAAMVVYMRHEGRTESDNDIFWSISAAALMLSPALLIFGPGNVTKMISYEPLGIAVPAMLWPVCLGVVSTGFAYFGISIILKSINANVYSLVDIIVSPVVAACFGYLIFGEAPSWSMVIGGAMLLGTGFWLTYAMAQRQAARQTSSQEEPQWRGVEA